MIQLEIGKTYLNGEGVAVKITKTEIHKDITHYIGDDEWHYTVNGHWSFDGVPNAIVDLISVVDDKPIRLRFNSFAKNQMGRGFVAFRQSDEEKSNGEYDPHVMFEHKDADVDDDAVMTKVERDCTELARLLNMFNITRECVTDLVKKCAVTS